MRHKAVAEPALHCFGQRRKDKVKLYSRIIHFILLHVNARVTNVTINGREILGHNNLVT